MRTASRRDHVYDASFAENWISSGYTRKIFQDKQVGGACMYEVALPCGT